MASIYTTKQPAAGVPHRLRPLLLMKNHHHQEVASDHHQRVLGRKKKCKERYARLKHEMDEATAALQRLEAVGGNCGQKSRLHSLIKIPNSQNTPAVKSCINWQEQHTVKEAESISVCSKTSEAAQEKVVMTSEAEKLTSEAEKESEDEWEYYEDEINLMEFHQSSSQPLPYYDDIRGRGLEPEASCQENLKKWTTAMQEDTELVPALNSAWFNEFEAAEAVVRLEETEEVSEDGLVMKLEATYLEDEQQQMMHGFYRKYCGENAVEIGHYDRGQLTGLYWRRLEGGAYVVASVGGLRQTYLYPDLSSALHGEAVGDKRRFRKANFSKVINVERSPCGLPVPVTRPFDLGNITYKYDPSTAVHLSSTPLVRDPYEQQTVYVAQSSLEGAGEGLFAKRSLGKGQLVALFNGVRVRHVIGAPPSPPTEYKICQSSVVDLDIPNWATSLKRYCATTGHKACHSFRPNATFSKIEHPRFGHIMCIMSIAEIEAGDEVFVNYNYRIWQGPEWYQQQYLQHLRMVEDVSEETLFLVAARIIRSSGTFVEIPPPPENSCRFDPCAHCGKHVGYQVVSVACLSCQKWCHAKCTALGNEQVLEAAAEGTLNFTCEKCLDR